MLYNTLLSLKSRIIAKYTAFIAALKALGAWGVLIIAFLDACAFGVPMDPLIAGYVFSNPHKTLLYCLAGSFGSAIGSLIPYALGRAGGELFLLKRINEAKLKRIRDRFERQEFLALMIPAMLPPPTPFKLLVFSAGVFEMKVLPFLAAIMLGRMLRFGIVSILTIYFGPQIVQEVRTLITHHPLVAAGIGIAILVAVYVVYRLLREPAVAVAKEIEESRP